MAGPYKTIPGTQPYSFLRTSPAFTIPKKGSDELRRIDNLSFPEGNSVNDNIDKLDFPVNYPSLRSVRELISRVPIGTHMSSRDIRKAYRQILIHPSDWPLLGLQLREKIF